MVKEESKAAFTRATKGDSNRDKASLDIFWLRDESLEESDNLPIPTFSPRKSSKTSKPPSNNSVKSPLT